MKLEIPHYSGWTPRSLRTAKKSSERGPQRDSKRNRLGTAVDRSLYKSAKPQRTNPQRYAQLCVKADGLNGRVKS